ncbi:MAG: nucleotidyltransferase family protein [candidate division WOR-3 bacterium]
MQALVLVGGLGLRLRPAVSDRPKCMALVAGRPFLEYVLRALCRQGVSDFVLATGYLAASVQSHFGRGERLGIRIEYSEESEPLGTAGAIRLAAQEMKDASWLVANGDSLLDFDLAQLEKTHVTHNALATLALVKKAQTDRYGCAELDAQGRVSVFHEKPTGGQSGLINGGVYLLDRRVLDYIPMKSKVSFETETLPQLLAAGVYGVPSTGYFIDIGLPEDLAHAQADPSELLRLAGLSGNPAGVRNPESGMCSGGIVRG